MNTLPEKREESMKQAKRHSIGHGRRIFRTILLTLALALSAWPAWNWVVAPLLTLSTLTYWQMSALVLLLGVVTRLFSTADIHRHRSPFDNPAADFAWSRCRRAANNHQG